MLKHISTKTFIVCAAIAGVFTLSATATRASEPIAVENISAIYNSVENIDALLEEAKANLGKPISRVVSSETKTFINGEEVDPSTVRIPEGEGKVINKQTTKRVTVTGSDNYSETELNAIASGLITPDFDGEILTPIGKPRIKTTLKLIEGPTKDTVEDSDNPRPVTITTEKETITEQTLNDGTKITTREKITITIELPDPPPPPAEPKKIVPGGNGNPELPIGINGWNIRWENAQADASILTIYNDDDEYIGDIVDKKYRDRYPDALGYMVVENVISETVTTGGKEVEAYKQSIIAANTPKLTATSNGDHAILEFDNKEGAAMNFDVVDVNGNTVKTITAQGNSFTVSGLASGIYFVKSKENPNMQTKIVIAQ